MDSCAWSISSWSPVSPMNCVRQVGVEPAQVLAEHRRGVARRVGRHEDDLQLLDQRRVEPAQGDRDVGHRRRADVGAVRVAEEQQRRLARGRGREVEGRAAGVGERERRPPVGLGQVEPGVGVVGPSTVAGAEARVVVPAALGGAPCRRPARRQPGGEQQRRQRRAQAAADGGAHEDTVRRGARSPRTTPAIADDQREDRQEQRDARRAGPPCAVLVRRRRGPSVAASVAAPRAPSAAGERQHRRRVLGLGLALDGRLDPGRLATVAVGLDDGEGRASRRPGTGRPTARTPGTARARCRRRVGA